MRERLGKDKGEWALEFGTWSLEFGTWSFGYYCRSSWPNKSWLSLDRTYYDGKHWVLHLGPFCLARSFY